MRSMWSFSALHKVMNGVRLTVGQIHSLGIAHDPVAQGTEMEKMGHYDWSSQ